MENRYLNLLAWLWILPLLIAAITWLFGVFARGDQALIGLAVAGVSFPFGALMLASWCLAGAIITAIESAGTTKAGSGTL